MLVVDNNHNKYPNLLFGFWPEISGEKTNIPKTGYALVYQKEGTLMFYPSPNLSWPESQPTQSDISLSVQDHDFGDVLVGDYTDWNLVISNVGDADLTVDSITPDNPAFTIPSPNFPQSILPDNSLDVTVRFSPPEEKPYTGTLTIASNDPDEPEVYVSVGGTGLPDQPPICVIELRKRGTESLVNEVNVGGFFDIYVGDSTDDTGIKEVRFLSDDSQDGNPAGTWMDWYDWNTSSGDWNATTKNQVWSFATGGKKEVWTEIKDDGGNFSRCHANIFVHPGYAIVVAGQGRWYKIDKWAADHSANNAYRALRNLGFDDNHIFYLNSNRPQNLDEDADDEVDYPALLSHFETVMNEVKDKIGDNPTPLILYLSGHGGPEECDGPHFFEFDEDAGEEGFLWVSKTLTRLGLQEMLDKFSDKTPMLIIIGSCYSGGFITSTEESPGSISAEKRIIITSTHDDIERLAQGWVRSSDGFWKDLMKGFSVKEAFVRRKIYPGCRDNLWLDDNGDAKGNSPDNLEDDGELAAITKIGIPGSDNLKLTPWILFVLSSPGEIRVYDSQGRVTGLVDGEVKEEIPNAIYDEENKTVIIFDPSDSYRYEVVGTDEGTYGLDITSIEDGEATTFIATDISITTGAVHQYTIDWEILSQDEKGVTVQIDFDGDGTSELTITTDRTFAPVSATIDLDPDTLNPKSKGKWITCYIELPEEHNVEEIDVSTVRLWVEDNQILAEGKPTEIDDYDKDGIPDLMLKFDRQSLIEFLENTGHTSGDVTLTVNGQVGDALFEGTDTIRVIGEKGLAAPAKPKEFALLQNFSNPFNPDTWIPYQLAEDVDVTIRLYNVSGQLVRTLAIGHKPAGFYTTKQKAAYWDGRNEAGERVSSGVYFYHLQAGDYSATKLMLVLK